MESDQPLLKPSRRHDHAYAIVRFDATAGDGVPLELRITVTKVVHDGNHADAEVRRLNELNRDKGACYFAQITRLERTPVAESESVSVQV